MMRFFHNVCFIKTDTHLLLYTDVIMVEGKFEFLTHQSVKVRKITQEKHELQSTLDNSGCLKVLLHNVLERGKMSLACGLRISFYTC